MTDVSITAMASEPGRPIDASPAKVLGESKGEDLVNSPRHYADGPVPDIECIQVTRWFNFNLGNAIKYVWRHEYKGNPIQDLKKARWYIDDEIARLEAGDPAGREINPEAHPGFSKTVEVDSDEGDGQKVKITFPSFPTYPALEDPLPYRSTRYERMGEKVFYQ